MRDIRARRAREQDLDALQNFHAAALMLMAQCTAEQWEQAQQDALIGAYLHGQVEDRDNPKE